MLAIIGTVIVVAGFTLGIILVNGDSDQSDPSVPDLVVRQKLTTSDRAKARRIVMSASDLKRILGDRQYEIRTIGIWEGPALRARRKLPGFVTIVRLSVDPSIDTLKAQWPFLSPDRTYPPCRREWVPLTASGLREVFVYVDLRRSLVASVVPGPTTRLRPWRVPPQRDATCGPAELRPSSQG